MAESNGKDAAAVSVSDLEKKIIRQVEYYFGDINLARDKFLQGEMKQDDGWVTLETMVKFNRLKELTEDQKAIADAMKKSTAGLLEVSEDSTKIRRCQDKPLPTFTKDRRDDLKLRSVYAKGFATDSSLDDILEFLEKYGPTEHIQRRKDSNKEFKGSIFAVFKTAEDTKKFMEEKDTKYGENEMSKEFKDDYFKRKNEEKKDRIEESRQNKEDKEQKQKDDEVSKLRERMIKGTILCLTKLPSEINREAMKEFFNEHAKVIWADYEKGDPEARLRFDKEGDAQKAWDKAKEKGEGKVTIKETEVEGRVLEGEEEEEHWKIVLKAQSDRRHLMRNKRQQGQGRGGGRGGRGGGGRGGRKRFGGDRGGPRNKKTKLNSDDEGGAVSD